MTTTIVSSGFTSSGLTAGAGDEIDIVSSGTTVSTTVTSGGFENVGGRANHTIVSSGGNQIVSDVGVASFATISNGGSQTVLVGGGANGTQVSSGGVETVSGGVATFTTVFSGGLEYVRGSALTSGDSVSNGGQEIVAAGGLVLNTQVSAGGLEAVSSGGTAISATVYGGGFQVVSSGGTASGTIVSSGGILSVFSGGTVDGTVVLDGGAIDLADVAYDSAGTASIDTSTDTLTIHEGGKDYVEQLSGDYTGEYFHLSDDGNGGSMVTEDGTPCYCSGTHILTDRGEIAVENLRIGDRLITASGKARPIRWIGMRSYSGRFAAGNKNVLPVVIRKDALDANLPKRDLWVSPLHAMFLDGVLIPAWALVDGVSIVQAARVDQVEYFHIELESHDVIVAEGALSESFLDDGNRGMFHNAPTYREIYPNAARAPARYCAPRVEDGGIVQSVRDRIDARFTDLDAVA